MAKVCRLAAIAAILFGVVACAKQTKFVVPNVEVEQLSPNEYSVQAQSLADMLVAMKCGEKGTCILAGGAVVYVVQLDPNTIYIQVPLRGVNDLMAEIRDLGYLALIDPSGRIFITQRR